jgi:hypothetical protein
MSLDQASLVATLDVVSAARQDQWQASDAKPIQPPGPAKSEHALASPISL